MPFDDPESTFGAYYDALFSRVPILSQNIHYIKFSKLEEDRPTSEELAKSIAEEYEEQLMVALADEVASGGKPKFDLILLGMGPDGTFSQPCCPVHY